MAYNPNTNAQQRVENFHYGPQDTRMLEELRKIRKELHRIRKLREECYDDPFAALALARRTRKKGVW